MHRCARPLQPSTSTVVARLSVSSRSYATASSYVPSRSNRDIAPPPETRKPKPTSASFFTARSSFNDAVLELQSLAKDAKHALRSAHIIPNTTKPLKTIKGNRQGVSQWKNAHDMGSLFHTPGGRDKKLPTGNYRKVIQVLGELSDYRALVRSSLLKKGSRLASSETLASTGSFLFPETIRGPTQAPLSPPTVFEKITELIRPFQRPSYLASQALALPQLDSAEAVEGEEGAVLENHQLQPVGAKARHGQAHLDELGRAYALGRRKESSARVWVVPARRPAFYREDVRDSTDSTPSTASTPETNSTSSPATPTPVVALSIPPNTLPTSPSPTLVTPQTSEILINNIPLHVFFANPADREKVVFPFKATGTLGKYNVFALVRGGGTTGQAGAVALGIARGVKCLWPGSDRILKRCGCFLFEFFLLLWSGKILTMTCV